jgi:hypothetical protein
MYNFGERNSVEYITYKMTTNLNILNLVTIHYKKFLEVQAACYGQCL